MVAEPLLEELYRMLEDELRLEGLGRVPRNLYREVAAYIKTINDQIELGERSIIGRLMAKEKELLMQLTRMLMEVRIAKVQQAINDIDYTNLTPEERFITEPITQFKRRVERVEKAIENGQLSVLEAIERKATSRYMVVRFLQPHPPTIGADLQKYGPYQKEDVAVLPAENARLLVKQGIAVELWDIE